MNKYENISVVRTQSSIGWQGQHSLDIRTSPTTQISVDAEAEIVTIIDTAKGRTIFIPFDNVVCMEQAVAKPVDVKPTPTVTEHQFKAALRK